MQTDASIPLLMLKLTICIGFDCLTVLCYLEAHQPKKKNKSQGYTMLI